MVVFDPITGRLFTVVVPEDPSPRGAEVPQPAARGTGASPSASAPPVDAAAEPGPIRAITREEDEG